MKMRLLTTLFCFFSLFIIQGQTFSDNPGTSIPDAGGQVCVDIEVTGVGIIGSNYGFETVCIDISHTYAGDLDIYLVAPDGTTVELTTDNGGNKNDYSITCFDDNAATSITANGQQPPYNGTYSPEGDLFNVNNGQNADGTWQLCVTDDSFGDTGTINGWDITFGNNPTSPPPPTDQDCNGAIPVCQETYTNTDSYSGQGNITNEINGSASCLGAGELNDVWYIFTVQETGDLSFDITPVNMFDDYDWAVYDLTNANCSDIYGDLSLEVSCNFSGVSGVTGPNGGSGSNSQGASGTNDNDVIPVVAGETYVINVSNYSSTADGYTLDFTNSSAVIFDNIPPEITSVQTPISCGETSISFDFSENILCNTVEDADFTLTGPGGPYTVSNVSGSNCNTGGTFEDNFTATISPAITTSGTFSLNLVTSSGSVTDNCGNVAPAGSLTFTITGVNADINSSTNVSCNGGSNGNATVTASNGTSPYTYLWDDPSAQTTATASNLSAGTYIVTVTDDNGCSGVDTIIITEPDPIILSASGTDETCANQNDGTATVSVTSGGTPDFSYSWNSTPAQNTANASNLPDGTYTVTVTDDNGCTETADVTINPGVTITADPSASANQCLDVNNISFTNNGSTGAGITYSWDFGDGSGTSTSENPSYTYSSTGTFTVSQTVTNGTCSDTETTTVTIYAVPTATASGTNPTCDGVCDGSIALTVSNGAPSYTYSWDNGAGSVEDPSGLCENTYTVTVTDNNGCTATASATLTAPDALTATISSSTNIDCDGDDDGTATVSVSGGTTDYTYLWDDPSAQTSATATGLDQGTYTVTVTDDNGCTTTASVTITEPDPIAITLTPTHLLCNGDGTGDIDATITGGTTAYSFSWSNSASTEDLTDVAAGTYTLTVTDANGCTETASETLTQPDALAITLTPTNPTCNSSTDGSIISSVSGGTTAYTYAWDDPATQSTANATGLTAGTFTLTVTDANGCTATASSTLTAPNGITLTVTGTDPSCNAVCDGTASASASGGTGTLTYAWDNGAGNNANASSLCGGTTYTVTVTDDNGCTETGSYTPTEPSAITLSTSGADANCNGDCDGTATATASGGTGTLDYAWNDPAFQTTATATGLCAGTFNVTITDDNGCTATDTYVVGEPDAITLTGSSTDATCGNNNGTATVTASGGAGSFTYLWDDPGTQTTATATGLNSGAYNVTVTDGNGCTETLAVNVSDSGGPTASITASTNVSCNGGTDGQATVTASGGTAPYTYAWNDPGTQSTATATGLAAGNYSVTVTDNIGCTTSASITITQPTALTASITASSNIDCDGDDDGTATVSVSGGTTDYTYLWDDPSAQTSATATGLDQGTYTVTVTDDNGCTTNASVTITEPDPIAITLTPTHLLCNGDGTGDIDATVTGGTTNYSYSWSNSASTEDLTDVAAGAYTLTVTDANGCTASASETLTQPTALSLSATNTNASCSGICDATGSATAGGGTGTIAYLWNDPSAQTTANATGLCGGTTYTVTITDDNGCTLTESISPTVPNGLAVSTTMSAASCNSNCDGEAYASATGGTSPYTYSWNDPAFQTNDTAFNVCAGSFTVTIMDANGCTASNSITVTEPSAITLTGSSVDASCGAATGSATVSASGGAGSYSYLWDDASAQTTATASNIVAGSYTVTVTDANGCSNSLVVNVTDAGAPTASISNSTNVLCNGDATGDATVTASGGDAPYTYLWNDASAQTTATANGLTAGTYSVTVTDNSGCSVGATVTITQPNAITGAITSFVNPTCFGDSDGSVTVSISGGSSPYSYLWDDASAQTTASANNLGEGTFSVTATDNNGCQIVLNQVLNAPDAINITSTITDVTCPGNADGAIDIDVTGGTSPYTYSWDNSASTQDLTNISGGDYVITVTDASGCTATLSNTVNENTALSASFSTTDSNCGQANGSATVTASGGSGGYTYLWNDASTQTTETASNLVAGSYTVTITDSDGCSEDFNVTISDSGGGTASISETSDVSCFGTCDGFAVAEISGGTAPFTYLWNDASLSTNDTLENACQGTYIVTITDANGCASNATATINGPTEVVLTLNNLSDVSCFGGNDGSIDIEVSGGSSPYTYAWSNSLTNQDLSGLTIGTYSVTVTDASGCEIDSSFIIREPTEININVDSSVDPLCFGENSGSINISVSGGTPPFSYSWNDASNQTTEDASLLGAGTYTVTVTDGNGCTSTSTTTLNSATQLTSNASSTSANCGNADGTATITASGGTGTFTYLWNDPASQTNATATNLSSGIYWGYVTDSNGCTDSSQVTVGNGNGPTATIVSQINTSCFGICDGSATLDVSGGAIPYTYLWDDPASQTTLTATNLCAGDFNVSITDNNGCSTSASVTITEPTALSVNTVSNDENCSGSCDGSIITSIIGGTAPFTYLWDDNTASTNDTLLNACSGTYNITVTDDNGCTAVNSGTINTPVFEISTTTLNANCGNNDGSATVTIDNGTAPFTYLWNDASAQTTATAANLTAGNYSVTVTDSAGCTLTAQANVSDAGGATVIVDSQSNPNCFGGADGSISVSATGGVGPYNYLWNDPASQTSSTAINLSSGTYSVTVTDANGCSSSIEITLTDPQNVTLSLVSSSDEACSGACNGNAVVSANGGSGNYTYSWNDPNNQSTSLATGLCAGTYTVSVFDDFGCTDDLDVIIEAPDDLTLTLTSNMTNCNGGCDGSTNVVASGGTPPYNYLWDDPNSQTTASANNLCAGSYTVSVTDNNGCNTSENIAVSEPDDITIIVVNQGNESCANSCDGFITISSSGGEGTYTYLWDDANAQTGLTASNLCGGDYTVTVTDGNGCIADAIYTVNSSSNFTTTIANSSVSCAGTCDGSLSPSISGGTSPYTYQWDDGSLQTDSTAINLCDGTYNLIVTDANGCTSNAQGVVNDPTELTLQSTVQDANCGNSDGQASVTVSSGTGPFTYAWNDPATQSTSTATGLSAGTYTCVVTDANGCLDSLTLNINNNGSPIVSILNQSNPLCANDSTGTISISINGGASPYTIQWDDYLNQTTVTASNLPSGTYSASVTDNNGCSASVTATIVDPDPINSTISNISDASCYDNCDGSATVLVSSGTSPYSYVWTDINNQTTSTATNLCAGTYTVTVSDANGCSSQSVATIDQPAILNTTISSSPSTCELDNGSATVNASGGSGNYTYLWNDASAQTSATASDLSSGTYIVVVSDVNNCTINDTIVVNNNNPQSLSLVDLSHETCFEENNGSIEVSVSGMIAPLTYAWDDINNTSTNLLENVGAGSYTITITDNDGCSIDSTFIINPALEITISDTVNDPTCYNECNGEIEIVVSGGVAPYSYSWNNPLLASDSIQSNLCSGNYTVTVEDANGCSSTLNYNLVNPSPMSINSTASNAHCGNADGTITTNVSNGTSPYTYQWNDPFSQTNATATGLEAGSYIVVVLDSNNCSISDTVQVIDLDGPTVFISTSQNVSCYGGANGHAMASIDGGEEPFAFIWDDPNTQTNNLATNLSAGTYTVTISDANNCSGAATVTITQPDSLQLFLSGTEPLCYDDCNGQISSTVVGGVGPFEYLWNDPAAQTSATASNLCEGDYELIVTDANGCYTIMTYELNEPTFLSGGVTTSETSCDGTCDGQAVAIGAGGTAPYSFSWNDPSLQTGTTASSLCAGSISVNITDANGCTATITDEITSPEPISISFNNVTPLSCYESCDGSAEAVPSGGTSPYTFLWNDANAQTTATLSDVCVKQYMVTVTDANGCSNEAVVNITQPQPLVATASSQQSSCFEACDGTATGAANGGTAPYSYLWDDNALQSTITATGLCAGIYNVVVTDTNNCTATTSVTVLEPSEIGVNFNITSSNCGNNNGQANAAVVGGTGPYTYQWNDGNNQTTSIAYNLFAGPYTLTVSDANGCSHVENINISDIEAPDVTLVDTNHVSCFNEGDGTISIAISGGVPNYDILWDDPASQTTALASGLDGGIYTVTVTDAAGCVNALSVNVDEPLQLVTAIAASNDASCFGLCDGFANSAVGGGTAPYSYQWNDPANQTTSQATNLCAGFYGILVTDANGCTASNAVLIKEPTELTVQGFVTNVNCYEGEDGFIQAVVDGGTAGYFYDWVPSGNSGSVATGLEAGEHYLTITDANGCVTDATYEVTQPPLLTVASTSFPATCDEDNGSANAIPNGGTPGYSYSWVPDVGDDNVANFLAPGGYTVTVTDANGCEQTRTINVYEIPAPSIEDFITTNTTCSGGSDGTSHVIVKDAVEPMVFSWSPSGGNDSLAFNLSAGIYTVTLTDGNGCSISASTVVESPDPVRIITDGETTICYGESAQISGSAYGGNGGYTYTWNDPDLDNNSIQVVDPLTTTTYNIFATDVYGCVSDIESITITVNPQLQVDAASLLPICLDDSIEVSAQAFDGNGGPYYYSWNTGDTTSTFYNTPTGTFTYIVTASDSCSLDAVDSTTVIVNPNPIVSFTSNVEDGCVALTVDFENTSDIGIDYLWEFGNGDSSFLENPIFEFDSVGSYDVTLTVTSTEGCTSSLTDSSYITVHPLPVAYFTAFPALTTTLSPEVHFTDGSQDAVSYSWNFGDSLSINNTSDLQNPSHHYNVAGHYTITQTVTNEFGCIDVYQDSIIVEEGFIIFFPNAFSPDGDGNNDTWKPQGTGIIPEFYELWVFDRWGNMIFHTQDPNEGWDGKVQHKGKKTVQEDVYVWKVKLIDALQNDHQYVGHVTVIK